jgi:hypothetical protein
MCESTEREHRKGALSGKTLLEFVFVRVTCDVTEKIRKKYRSNKESEMFCVSSSPKRRKRNVLVSVPPRRKTFRHLEVKFWCFEEFFERRCSYR